MTTSLTLSSHEIPTNEPVNPSVVQLAEAANFWSCPVNSRSPCELQLFPGSARRGPAVAVTVLTIGGSLL